MKQFDPTSLDNKEKVYEVNELSKLSNLLLSFTLSIMKKAKFKFRVKTNCIKALKRYLKTLKLDSQSPSNVQNKIYVATYIF